MIIRQTIQKVDGTIKYREYLKQIRLGKGGFAECYQVQRLGDKKKFALKIVKRSLLQKPKARQKMLSEIKLHRLAKHRNICQLQAVFEDQDFVYMLLELCSNGNMFDLMKKRKKLTIPEAQFFLYQLIDALCYLHNKQIVHRDVKLGNLLIDDQLNLKVADFGLATKIAFIGDRKHTVCGTPNYIAPEVIKASLGKGTSGHSYQADVWSTGVIMYLLLIGKAPFETSVVDKTYQRIIKGKFQFPESFKDDQAKDLLRKILQVDPSKRYTFKQILDHPFMNPKNGIPKQLPLTSLSRAPQLGEFEKYEQEQVKQSARSASIMTLRTNLDLTIEEDMSTFFRNRGSESKKSNSKDAKGLKSFLSGLSMSNSLKKLTQFQRSSSPQNQTIQPRITRARSRSKEYFKSQAPEQIKSKQMNFVYVLSYRADVVWNYILSNGYLGTFEPHYKLLYNRHDGIYFEVDHQGTLRKIKKGAQILNDDLVNRKKFFKNYHGHRLQCQPYVSKERVIYITKIYKVDSQNIILFRLSNQHTQAFHYKKNLILILTDEDLLMVELENGREISRCLEKKKNYAKCSAKMIELYYTVKKIMLSLNRVKKSK